MRWSVWYKLLWLLGLSIGMLGASGGGCGGESLFENLGDDGSRQAKLEAAQLALDKEDCQTALNLFTQVYGSSPSNVKERINLAAAHVCQAGFKTTALVSVAADFGSGVVLPTQLFNEIASTTVKSLDSDWPTEIGTAKDLLAQSPITNPPTPYNNDPDAGFNLSIVTMIEATFTVVDILNYVNGVVDCNVNQGSSSFNNCEISSADVNRMFNGLQDSSSLLESLGLSSDITRSIDTILDGLKAADGDSNTTTCTDIVNYLDQQNIISDPSQVQCV